MKHSPEPWEACDDSCQVLDASGRVVFCEQRRDDRRQLHDAKRIAACVNAMRGIPDEKLHVVGEMARSHPAFYKEDDNEAVREVD